MPLQMEDWLQWDDASEAQIVEKQRLLAEYDEAVLKVAPDTQTTSPAESNACSTR